jgi:release factor glutamine methyltransferase
VGERFPAAIEVGRAGELLRAALVAAGVEAALAAAESTWMLAAITGLSGPEQRLERRRPLTSEDRQRLEGWLRRREAREPLQRILGEAPFYGLALEVPEGVLIPRPETESLVALVLEAVRGHAAVRVHDVGCGSGAVALAVARERPDARVSASDISPVAVAVTRSNALRLGLEVAVVASDLLTAPAVAAWLGGLDVLVANLPYLPEGDRATIPPEVRHDPPEALFAGPDGLSFARALVAQATPALAPGALLALELDPRNVDALADVLRADARWAEVRCERDLNRRPRFVLARRAGP